MNKHKISRAENEFLNKIGRNADAFDFANADTAPPMNSGNAHAAAIKGNPAFVATFNLNFKSLYFTLNGGTYTPILPAALNAGLKSDLPFFVFGQNDFASGFKKAKGEFNLSSNWTYGRPGIYGKDDFAELAFDANVTGLLQTGDMIVPITSALPGGGTTTLCLQIVRCPEVAYGTLLDMISASNFLVNGVRYTLPDTSQLSQYSKQIQFQDLSIFGKFDSDKLTPNDYKVPSQFQNGIVDIPIAGKWGNINTFRAWGFFNIYTNVETNWTLFVQVVNKAA